MKTMRTNKIRPDLKATLNEGDEGTDVVIERLLTPRIKTRILLTDDEWQEMVDWVRATSLLHREKQT